MSGGLDATAAVAMFSPAGLESEFADGAAGGFAAGKVGLVGVVVFVVGAVVAVSASGGVEDLGLLPSEGDGALMSSTGLFYKRAEEILVFERYWKLSSTAFQCTQQ